MAKKDEAFVVDLIVPGGQVDIEGVILKLGGTRVVLTIAAAQQLRDLLSRKLSL